MRRILCEKCLREHLPPGERMVSKRTMTSMAEYQRLILGTALDPTKEQRTVYLNGEPRYLTTTAFNCDSCDAEIHPQAVCAAWSVWREDMQPVPAWEENYLKPMTYQEYKSWEQVNARLGSTQGDRKR